MRAVRKFHMFIFIRVFSYDSNLQIFQSFIKFRSTGIQFISKTVNS